MKISELIGKLGIILAEHGDAEAVVTEWAGANDVSVGSVVYQDKNEYGHQVHQVYIGGGRINGC